jgi:XTP/dITP diphosphohydrolase
MADPERETQPPAAQPPAAQPPAAQPRPARPRPAAGGALIELVAIMGRLRRECPWDARQTHESLRPYLLEEAYETLDALDRGAAGELCEELGDLLLQVLFHAAVAAERADGTGFDIDDVASGIAAKLVRRHPHVFAGVVVADADEVKRNWTAIKAAERAAASDGAATSVLDGVPLAQPALALAAQLQRRAQAADVPADLADLTDVRVAGPAGPDQAGDNPGAVGPDVAGAGTAGPEVAGAGAAGAGAAGESLDPAGSAGVSELGAELFSLVARARSAGLNPELELRRAALAYRERVRAWESTSSGQPRQ